MSRQIVAWVTAAVLGGLVVILLSDRPAPAQPVGGGGGVQLVADSGCFVLVETGTDRSWVMFPKAADKKWAWFPVKRLENDQQVQMWRVGAGKD